MKIQYISDIHLEYYGDDIIELPIMAEYLALVGDIGNPTYKNYDKFLNWCSNNYRDVFLVLGNHEHYHLENMLDMDEIVNKIVIKYSNVHFLNNSSYIIDDYIFLGTILWSYVPNNAKNIVEKYDNDYRCIKLNGVAISVDITNKLFHKNVKWLEEEIDQFKDKKVIVLTHFAPLMRGTSDPKYEIDGRLLNHAFASDLSYLMEKPIKLWIFGHTHWTCNFTYNGVQIVSNGVGYKGEKTYTLTEYVSI